MNHLDHLKVAFSQQSVHTEDEDIHHLPCPWGFFTFLQMQKAVQAMLSSPIGCQAVQSSQLMSRGKVVLKLAQRIGQAGGCTLWDNGWLLQSFRCPASPWPGPGNWKGRWCWSFQQSCSWWQQGISLAPWEWCPSWTSPSLWDCKGLGCCSVLRPNT